MYKSIFRYVRTFLCLTVFLMPVPAVAQIKDVHEQVNKVGQVLFFVSQFYPDSINAAAMTDQMLKDFVSKLDPHSSYIPAAEVRALSEQIGRAHV